MKLNFVGRRTKITDRRKRMNDIIDDDEYSKIHDMLYNLAPTEEQLMDADRKMMRNLNKLHKSTKLTVYTKIKNKLIFGCLAIFIISAIIYLL